MKEKTEKRIPKLRNRRLVLEIGAIIFGLFFIFMGMMIAIPSLIIKSQTKKSYYEMAQEIVKSRSN